MRKGVSPLISITLLIAIVVAAAFVFGQWVQPFTEDQTRIAENESSRFHQCKNVYIRILDLSSDRNEVNVTLMNAGPEPLAQVNVAVTRTGTVIAQKDISNLTSAEHRSLRIDTAGEQGERIVAIPQNCPRFTTEQALP